MKPITIKVEGGGTYEVNLIGSSYQVRCIKGSDTLWLAKKQTGYALQGDGPKENKISALEKAALQKALLYIRHHDEERKSQGYYNETTNNT